MENNRYIALKNIKISDCDLILKKYSILYIFCIKNNIENIGDLLFGIENHKFIFRNKSSKEEILGMVDLIRYYYYGNRLQCEKLLNDNVLLIEDVWKNVPCKGSCDIEFDSKMMLNPLRRLGFSSNECDFMRFFVLKYGKNISIINLMYAMKDNILKLKGFKCIEEKEIFLNKINILIEYYNKYLRVDEENRRVDELLNEYKRIEEKIKELKTLSNSIRVQLQNISGYCDINKLIKKM